jgi:sulfate/thiosulfate transport system permease protein
MALKKASVLPGFSLAMGITLVYLSLLVLIPLSTIFLQTAGMGLGHFWSVVSSPRVMAAYRLSFGAAFIAALADSAAGFLAAWALTRYRFPGANLFDAIVDLPLALPTSVAGITLTAIFAANGIAGSVFADMGIKVAYTRLGVVVAMIFVGVPFVVRTVQPVLQELDLELEEAAETLGATRLQTFAHVIIPAVLPSILTGFALAFARAIGEYGSVIFISGNMPMRTEIAPLLIVTELEQFDYHAAAAIALVMLIASFVMLLAINLLQRWTSRIYAI